jgi:hypothetical protein
MQKYEEKKKFMYADAELVLSRASHPTDIEWLNMDVTDGERFNKVTTAYVIIMMVLVFSAAALIGIDFLKLKGMREESDISQESKLINYSLTIFGSVVTSVINNGIWQMIVALSGYEKHQTSTNKIASQIVKTIIAQFINTVLILYLIQVFNQRPYLSSAGLVVQSSTYIVVSGFISIIINAINIPLWVRYGMLWWKYSYYTRTGME